MIVEDSTIERPWGWVFFYESRRFLDTGDSSARFAGNAPIIVERETGELLDTGTAHPVEFYLDNYEATDPTAFENPAMNRTMKWKFAT